MRAQVRASHVEFLGIAYNGPIDGDGLAHNAEFDEGPEFADHVQALHNGGGVAGGLNIDIAANSFREFAHFVDDVDLGGIEHEIGAASFGGGT